MSNESSTHNFRERAADFRAFIADVFSWRSFAGYRQRPEAFVVGSTAILLRLLRKESRAKLARNDGLFSLLFVLMLLPLSIVFAVVGGGRLGNATILALVIVGWGFVLALSDHAEFANWSIRVQFAVFVILTGIEVGAVAALGRISPTKHTNVSALVWGVVFAGALDVSASLVTLVVRLRSGRPFGAMIDDDWERLRARGLTPP